MENPYFFVEKGRLEKSKEHYGKLEKEFVIDDRSIRENQVSTYRLSAVIQSARSPIAIKETLLLAGEREKLRKYKEKGKGSDNVELS